MNTQKRQKVILLFAGLLAFFAAPQTADATMFRCISPGGSPFYTNVRNNSSCTPLVFQRKDSSRKFRMGGRSNNYRSNNHTYDSWIRTIANRYGVDDALIKAIIHIESGFNHRAVSHKGAKGLMQLMPQTSRELQVHNPFDPRQNIDGGTRYFRRMLDDFNGNISLSLAAYNAGPALVKRIGRIPSIPETRDYVRKVLRMYRIYKN